MNVLEKILEEILQYRKDNNLYAGRQVMEIERIIRSHMEDLPDTNVGKWIPVTERLPENDDPVFITYENKEDGHRSVYVSSYVTATSGGRKLDFKKWTHPFLYFNKWNRVVAWMPFPESYKGE